MVNDKPASHPSSGHAPTEKRRTRRKRKHTVSVPLDESAVEEEFPDADRKQSDKSNLKTARGKEALDMLRKRRMAQQTPLTGQLQPAKPAAPSPLPTPPPAKTPKPFSAAQASKQTESRPASPESPITESTDDPSSSEKDSIKLISAGPSFQRSDPLARIRARRAKYRTSLPTLKSTEENKKPPEKVTGDKEKEGGTKDDRIIITGEKHSFQRSDPLAGLASRARKKSTDSKRPPEQNETHAPAEQSTQEPDDPDRLSLTGAAKAFQRDDGLTSFRDKLHDQVQEKPSGERREQPEKEQLENQPAGVVPLDESVKSDRLEEPAPAQPPAAAPPVSPAPAAVSPTRPEPAIEEVTTPSTAPSSADAPAKQGSIVVRQESWEEHQKKEPLTADAPTGNILLAKKKDDGIAFHAEELQKSSLRAVIISNRLPQIHLAYRVLITLTGGEIDLVACKNYEELKKRTSEEAFRYAMLDEQVGDRNEIKAFLDKNFPGIKIKVFNDLKNAPGAK